MHVCMHAHSEERGILGLVPLCGCPKGPSATNVLFSARKRLQVTFSLIRDGKAEHKSALYARARQTATNGSGRQE
jgi:hypothetical protein